ncbi:cell division control protein 45 homolog isoform X3 [Pecten maximus]|uniref:cell division control protein 45 homolog isoform X1 n=1 Tax=Pecten maximus TaxID=6579 RepID=UPI0014588879|nr:cell division control protein 45 homolog isoform X1 [Pecten maximus]XP_033747413.1 cell division control protein 45 homolog isoform X2 [Pecten maximus]XP_033747414.1 cell division control protein 45 homolog isoform X3 [Pecten maximus]
MFVKDFRKGFYDVVQNHRVLVLVAFDVDALCACKILQCLFQSDQILYTIVPVSGREELERAYVENSEGIKHVLMINCGGTIDVVETLQPEECVRFYICDSHRPIDIHNIYNAVQVKLLMKEDEFDDLPEYDQVFRDETDDESGNESDDSEKSGKRKRYDDDYLEKKRLKRLWNEERSKLLFEYSQFSTYGTAAALLIFELAWKMSKDTNDLLWLSILGVTDQFIHYKTPRDKYIDDVMALQSHVSRHNHRDDEDNILSVNCLKISFDEELQLPLYRHWSLFESISHSTNMACKFKVWTLKGQKRLHEFLAEMGIPLTQCKQKYAAMDSSMRNNVKTLIQEHMTKYGLVPQDVVFPSFFAQYGYKNKLCATDVVLGCVATLESIEKGKSATDHFLNALDVLQRGNVIALEKSLVCAKMQVQALVTQVRTFLDMHQVISAGPFLYAFIQEGTADVKYFSTPQCLMRLARFTQEAHCSVSRNKRARSMPLVLGAPLDSEQGTTLVIGIPPLQLDDERKNFFGKAFEQAAVGSNARTLLDSFDTFVVEMKTEDKSKFFDALISLLQ